VIGNDRPETSATPTLRYADDDAVATHQLLVEAGVHSVLLARLDDDTRRFHPAVVPDGLPRGAAFDAAVERLFAQMRQVRARGGRAELFIYYSGHGDVEGGEGYVLLEDRRLFRRDLYAMLVRSPAARNHVFIDACKSYFLAFERGPGAGERLSVPAALVPSAEPARLQHVGFVLSTSSDRESHEWERFQGGVFSHELRSALRGAADADGDGRITYAELGAFVLRANQAIENPRFRPDVLVRAPDEDLNGAVLSWRGGDRLPIQGGSLGHVYLEDVRGERLLDVNPAPGQRLSLHLPAQRPLFLRRHDGTAEQMIDEPPAQPIATPQPRPPLFASRGALQLAFESFFQLPFGVADVGTFEHRELLLVRRQAAAADVAERDAAAARVRSALGWTAAGALAGGLALSGVALERSLRQGGSQVQIADDNRLIGRVNLASFVCYGVAAIAGGTWAFLTWRRAGGPLVAPTAAPGEAGVSLSFAY